MRQFSKEELDDLRRANAEADRTEGRVPEAVRSTPQASEGDPLEGAPPELAEAAQQLNDARDDLNESIAKLDKVLQKLNLGVRAWSSVFENQELTIAVGYDRVANGWGIIIAKTDTHTHSEWRFAHAPRELRMMVIDHIPALLGVLERKAQEKLVEVTAAVKTAQIIAENFGPKKA